MKQLIKIPAPIPEDLWIQAEPLLESSLTKTKNIEWTVEDMRKYVDLNQGALFAVMDGPEMVVAIVCGLSDYHQTRVLEVFQMAAKPKSKWDDYFPEFLDLARSEGCKLLRVSGRRWVKTFSKYGEAREIHKTELML